MPRTAPITAHVEPDIKAAFERLAKDDGRTLSQYVERLLIAHLAAADRSKTSRRSPKVKPEGAPNG